MSIGVIASHAAAGGGGSAFQSLVAGLPNLEAYWKADENPGGAGATAVDSSGNSRDGTYIAGTPNNAASLLSDGVGKSLRTAYNSGEGISIPDAPWMDMPNISVGCLFKLTDISNAGSGNSVISRYTAAGGFNWVLLRAPSSGFPVAGSFIAQVRNTGGSVVNADSLSAVVLNAVNLVGFTYDGSDVRLWVNAVNVDTKALAGTLQTGSSPIEISRYSQAAATTPGADTDEIFITSGVVSGSDWSALNAAK